MENASISVTPIQMLLVTAFQIWMVVFPIILIRKINYLTNLIEEKFFDEDKSTDQSAS